MSINPRVSIIIPMYNVEQYVYDSIQSALLQTYRNIEIICINDGSTDNTVEIAKRAIQGDNRARIIEQVNKGLSAARNTGLLAARGDYVFFLDSDDKIVNIAIAKLVEEAEHSGAQIVAAKFSQDSTFCDSCAFENGAKNIKFEQVNINDFYYQKKITNHSHGKLFSRRLFSSTGIVFPIGRSYEDVATTYRLMEAAAVISSTETPLYYYRINDAGIAHTYTLKNVKDLETAYNEIKQRFGNNPTNPQRFYILTVLYTLLRLINLSTDEIGTEAMRNRLEREYNSLFRISALNLRQNSVFTLKLFLRRLYLGKWILRRCGK